MTEQTSTVASPTPVQTQGTTSPTAEWGQLAFARLQHATQAISPWGGYWLHKTASGGAPTAHSSSANPFRNQHPVLLGSQTLSELPISRSPSALLTSARRTEQFGHQIVQRYATQHIIKTRPHLSPTTARGVADFPLAGVVERAKTDDGQATWWVPAASTDEETPWDTVPIQRAAQAVHDPVARWVDQPVEQTTGAAEQPTSTTSGFPEPRRSLVAEIRERIQRAAADDHPTVPADALPHLPAATPLLANQTRSALGDATQSSLVAEIRERIRRASMAEPPIVQPAASSAASGLSQTDEPALASRHLPATPDIGQGASAIPVDAGEFPHSSSATALRERIRRTRLENPAALARQTQPTLPSQPDPGVINPTPAAAEPGNLPEQVEPPQVRRRVFARVEEFKGWPPPPVEPPTATEKSTSTEARPIQRAAQPAIAQTPPTTMTAPVSSTDEGLGDEPEIAPSVTQPRQQPPEAEIQAVPMEHEEPPQPLSESRLAADAPERLPTLGRQRQVRAQMTEFKTWPPPPPVEPANAKLPLPTPAIQRATHSPISHDPLLQRDNQTAPGVSATPAALPFSSTQDVQPVAPVAAASASSDEPAYRIEDAPTQTNAADRPASQHPALPVQRQTEPSERLDQQPPLAPADKLDAPVGDVQQQPITHQFHATTLQRARVEASAAPNQTNAATAGKTENDQLTTALPQPTVDDGLLTPLGASQLSNTAVGVGQQPTNTLSRSTLPGQATHQATHVERTNSVDLQPSATVDPETLQTHRLPAFTAHTPAATQNQPAEQLSSAQRSSQPGVTTDDHSAPQRDSAPSVRAALPVAPNVQSTPSAVNAEALQRELQSEPTIVPATVQPTTYQTEETASALPTTEAGAAIDPAVSRAPLSLSTASRTTYQPGGQRPTLQRSPDFGAAWPSASSPLSHATMAHRLTEENRTRPAQNGTDMAMSLPRAAFPPGQSEQTDVLTIGEPASNGYRSLIAHDLPLAQRVQRMGNGQQTVALHENLQANTQAAAAVANRWPVRLPPTQPGTIQTPKVAQSSTLMPVVATAQPSVVQRTAVTPATGSPQVVDMAVQPDHTAQMETKAPKLNIDNLARQVLPFIKRLLAIERERMPPR